MEEILKCELKYSVVSIRGSNVEVGIDVYINAVDYNVYSVNLIILREETRVADNEWGSIQLLG